MLTTPRTVLPKISPRTLRSQSSEVLLRTRQSEEKGLPSHHPPQTASWFEEVLNAANPYRGSGSCGILHSSSSKPNVSTEERGPSEASPPKSRSPGGERGSMEEPENEKASENIKREINTKFGRQCQSSRAGCHSTVGLDHVLDPLNVAGHVGVDPWC